MASMANPVRKVYLGVLRNGRKGQLLLVLEVLLAFSGERYYIRMDDEKVRELQVGRSVVGGEL